MKTRILSAVVLIFLTVASFAQDPTAKRKKEFNLSGDGLAIQGYDAVAYFTQGKAVKGKSDFSIYYQGVTYRFASLENKEAFKKSPSRYEPQYGGWCAYALGAKGEKVSIDPGTFKILGGKLYLFYNSWGNNTLKDWNKDENNLKVKADQSWTKFYQ
jgi:YHS domain-containing protein